LESTEKDDHKGTENTDGHEEERIFRWEKKCITSDYVMRIT